MKNVILAALAAVTLAGCVLVPAYPEAGYYPSPAYYPAPAVGVVGIYPGRGYYRGHGPRHHRGR